MVICLFGATSSPRLDTPLGGVSTLERVVRYIGSLDTVERVAVFLSGEEVALPKSWDVVRREEWTLESLVAELAGLVSGPDDELLFAFLDQPFLNLELTERMLERHRKYRADYTFSDGYPKGLAPELVAGRAVAHLRELAQGDQREITRDGVFAVVQKEINRLDVETELSPVDQRLLRLVLAVDTAADFELCRRLAPNAPESIDEWQQYVEARRNEHRTLPRFVSVQVVEQEVHAVSYSPYRTMRSDVTAPGRVMDADRFGALVEQIANLSPEAVVSVSAWGEISRHGEVGRLIDSVLATEGLSLIVETSGVGWSELERAALFARLRDSPRGRLVVITGLDTANEDLYRELRGDGFEEANNFARASLEIRPSACHVQAVRCTATEPLLEEFYRTWKKLTPNVIIQKYDHFCGVLPPEKIGDLSPLDRFPCWHIQRDVTVLVDGTVPMCREDIAASRVLGNVFDRGIEEAWLKAQSIYERHVSGDYPDICKGCDEYYTFNY